MQNDPKISPTQPIPGTPAPNPAPAPTVQPSRPDVEINPGKIGNNTEVDLDTTKIKTYPDETPPEKNNE